MISLVQKFEMFAGMKTVRKNETGVGTKKTNPIQIVVRCTSHAPIVAYWNNNKFVRKKHKIVDTVCLYFI